MIGTDWQDNAACVGTDPEAFFPSGPGMVARREAQPAIAICHTCPVQVQCALYAMEGGDRNGVWGGVLLTEKQARRDGRPAPIRHGTPGGARAHQRRGESACASCAEANRRYESERKRKRSA